MNKATFQAVSVRDMLAINGGGAMRVLTEVIRRVASVLRCTRRVCA